MDIKQIRKQNLLTLIDAAGSRRQFLDRSGMGSAQLTQLIGPSPTRNVGDELARKLEDIFHRPYGWMDVSHSASEKLASINVAHEGGSVIVWEDKQDLPDSEFVFIPRLDVKLSAGIGSIVWEINESQPQAYRLSWLQSQGLNPEHLASMKVLGDSMEYTLKDGDRVLVDTSQTELIDGKIFALRYGDELRIKRLFKLANGGIRIVSDNREYPEEPVSPDDLEFVEIIGRVVQRSGVL